MSDGVNQTVAAPLTISVGNRPRPTIVSPTDGAFFTAGDVISFSGDGDRRRGRGAARVSAFTWNIDFLHEGHVHPGTPVTGVKSGTFTIPTTGHDFSGNTRYRITLTVVDSSGLTSSTRSVTIWPRKVNLTFTTVPSGLTLYLDGIARTAPFVYDTLVGFNHTIEARDQALGGTNYTFASWSDGGARQHTIVVPAHGPDVHGNVHGIDGAVDTSLCAGERGHAADAPGNGRRHVPAAQTAGNTNIVAIGWNDATSAITSVTDASGNMYQVAAPTARGTGLSQAIYYAKNIKAAAGGQHGDGRLQRLRAVCRCPRHGVQRARTDKSVRHVGLGVRQLGDRQQRQPDDIVPGGVVFGAGMTSGGFTASGAGFTTRIITVPDTDIVNDRVVNADRELRRHGHAVR